LLAQDYRDILLLPLHLLRGRCMVKGFLMNLDVAVTPVEVSVEDVQRILDLGCILRSVLTKDELMELEQSIKQTQNEIGNTGDS